ncbi:MAG: GDSL-type esterase/lipase family protein [Pyrinomonadaceae bacterium]|nr:GDSL-type esterase/lipase family protein [Pyrinomonadaceae bacterium]
MKKLIFSAIFALFLFSFAIAAQEYSRAAIWDKEIDALTEIDLKQTPPKDAVLFVGSSSIRLWRNLRTSFPEINLINRGFGGSRLEDVNFYFDRIVAPYAPKTIVLYAGENDVNDGIAPEKVLADFRQFSRLVRARFPKAKLLYVSLKPSPSRWKLADNFRKTNALIKAEIAKDKRARFVDVWQKMLNEKGEPKAEIFVEDKLHMNEKGYAIWREILAEKLK